MHCKVHLRLLGSRGGQHTSMHCPTHTNSQTCSRKVRHAAGGWCRGWRVVNWDGESGGGQTCGRTDLGRRGQWAWPGQHRTDPKPQLDPVGLTWGPWICANHFAITVKQPFWVGCHVTWGKGNYFLYSELHCSQSQPCAGYEPGFPVSTQVGIGLPNACWCVDIRIMVCSVRKMYSFYSLIQVTVCFIVKLLLLIDIIRHEQLMLCVKIVLKGKTISNCILFPDVV